VNQFFAGVTQVPDYGSGALLRGAVRVLFQIFSLGDEQQRTSVAARLAGAGVFDVAAAGKPDCYRNLICC
jgi:monomeric isocitrate dehydrogenase